MGKLHSSTIICRCMLLYKVMNSKLFNKVIFSRKGILCKVLYLNFLKITYVLHTLLSSSNPYQVPMSFKGRWKIPFQHLTPLLPFSENFCNKNKQIPHELILLHCLQLLQFLGNGIKYIFFAWFFLRENTEKSKNWQF